MASQFGSVFMSTACFGLQLQLQLQPRFDGRQRMLSPDTSEINTFSLHGIPVPKAPLCYSLVLSPWF